jgi:hypothetical protein
MFGGRTENPSASRQAPSRPTCGPRHERLQDYAGAALYTSDTLSVAQDVIATL